MLKTILYKMSRGEDGYYVATATDYAIVTQGKTFETLLENTREATDVHFDLSA